MPAATERPLVGPREATADIIRVEVGIDQLAHRISGAGDARVAREALLHDRLVRRVRLMHEPLLDG